MVYELLKVGKQNALTVRELSEQLQVSEAAVRKTVKQERKRGHPICATAGRRVPGYYLPADRREMVEYCNDLRHKISAMMDTLKVCMKIMQCMERTNSK